MTNLPEPIYAPTLTQNIVQELQTEELTSTPEVVQQRLTVCSTCEHRVSDAMQIPMCNLCGCNIVMMATMNFKTCPIGLWS